MVKEQGSRNINLDLIRCVAVLFVLSVHFLLNNEFYGNPVVGKKMFLMCIMRTLFICCVPLFLMLTGYLMNEKKLSTRYFFKIRKTYITYVLASIFCVVFSIFVLRVDKEPKQWILGIFDFTTASYSWYIEMYIGIFFLIPFLNILYHGLETKKKKQSLLLIMLVTTALPSLMNCWNFEMQGWWQNPSVATSHNQLIPRYWELLWPITYYYLGAYYCEYRVKLRKIVKVTTCIVSVIAFAVLNYWKSHEICYVSGPNNSYQGYETMIISFLLFDILCSWEINRIPGIMKKLICRISDLSLGIYLTSSVIDAWVYPQLCKKVTVMTNRIVWFLPVVLFVFFCVWYFIMDC